MSFIFRDPFFNVIDDYMLSTLPSSSNLVSTNDNADSKIRRDMITPFSGFGRMDMHEGEKDFELTMDLPGMNKSEINISTENNKLVIEGERKEEKKEDDEERKCHFMERHFGNFHREVALPKNANIESISAMYENGVLKVMIPKTEPASEKKTVVVNQFIYVDCLLYKHEAIEKLKRRLTRLTFDYQMQNALQVILHRVAQLKQALLMALHLFHILYFGFRKYDSGGISSGE